MREHADPWRHDFGKLGPGDDRNHARRFLCSFGGDFDNTGMVGQPPLDLNLRCPPSLVVADLVYDPLVTGLLALARARGLRTADGLGMLLHQAVRGFQLWFGVRPEVTAELRALIEADLLKKK